MSGAFESKRRRCNDALYVRVGESVATRGKTQHESVALAAFHVAAKGKRLSILARARRIPNGKRDGSRSILALHSERPGVVAKRCVLVADIEIARLEPRPKRRQRDKQQGP